MATAGASGEDIDHEVEVNSSLEATYDDYIIKLTQSLKQCTIFRKYVLQFTQVEVWMEQGTASSSVFLTEGRKYFKDLEELISSLGPYSKRPFIQPLVPKA